ncbi:hypothetical protein B484DRAFT_445158 [Ochromonadaceae sp. CCMP2298]|nr:hypothetical protein B484DRAFT_445158 [Ochromonadaceae sp. CCMP2298]
MSPIYVSYLCLLFMSPDPLPLRASTVPRVGCGALWKSKSVNCSSAGQGTKTLDTVSYTCYTCYTCYHTCHPPYMLVLFVHN